MNRSALEALIAEGLSSRQIANQYNSSGTNVRYWLQKHGLTTQHPAPCKRSRQKCKVCDHSVSRNMNTYCSVKCAQELRYRQYIARWKAGLETGNRGKKILSVSAYVRRYLMKKCKEQCSRCGWAEKNPVTGRVPLTIEHIDGNWKNTVEDNLDLICPNCHSLTPTYGALNKGNGRSDRYCG